MRYAKDVVFSTLRFKMHQWGMLCDLRYRRIEPGRYEEKTYLAYSSHAIALALVDKYKPKTVLDIGCGPGFVARECRRRGVEVTGMDMSPPLPDTVHHFRQGNLEQDPPSDALQFDMVMLLDVIEHLAEPEDFLVRLRNAGTLTSPDHKMPVFLISTPNIAFAAVRMNLLLGRFNYAERGILDITHKRLFTRKALLVALRDCGYDILETRAAGVPFGAVAKGPVGRVLGTVSGIVARIWPSMFAFQTIVVCRPKAGVRQLIQLSERHNTVSPAFRGVLEGAGEEAKTGA
jgi:2-polyprenyl-3-methyl-5-hydroxy-6-metoxy-1,4-benzoquinol methylase